MVIWFSAGRGLSAFVRPLFGFAWPVLLVIALLSLAIWPWANQQTQELKDRYGSRGDLERVAPGQFQESASGRRVFFLDKDTPDNKSGRNIFISSVERDKETVTSARSGRVETIGDGQFLLLSNGQRLENSLKGQGMRISEFEQHGSRVNGSELGGIDDTPAKARSTLDLMREPTATNRGELAWRRARTGRAELRGGGDTVSSVNPRGPQRQLCSRCRLHRYFNMLNLRPELDSSNKAGFTPFMLLVHGGRCRRAAVVATAQQLACWPAPPPHRQARMRTIPA